MKRRENKGMISMREDISRNTERRKEEEGKKTEEGRCVEWMSKKECWWNKKRRQQDE